MHQGCAPFAPDPEQNDRADDRHDESSRMKSRAGGGVGENPPDQATHDGSTDAKQRREPKSHMQAHELTRNPADKATDKERPKDLQHDWILRAQMSPKRLFT